MEFIQTNISLTPKQREKLETQQRITGKSMSLLLRDLIEEKYPDPPPFQPEITPNLQKIPKPAIVETRATDEDFKQLFDGWSPELYNKFKIKNG